MVVHKHVPGAGFPRWPSPDWRHAHPGHRLLKATLQSPLAWLSRLNVKGEHHVPGTGGALLALTPLSWAGPLLVGAAIHRPVFYPLNPVAFRPRVAAKAIRALGRPHREASAEAVSDPIARGLDLLERGFLVGVFPDFPDPPGPPSRDPTALVRLAARSGAPIVPIVVEAAGSRPLPRGLRQASRLVERTYVNVGHPMRMGLTPNDEADPGRLKEAVDDVVGRMRGLLDEAAAAKEANVRWA